MKAISPRLPVLGLVAAIVGCWASALAITSGPACVDATPCDPVISLAPPFAPDDSSLSLRLEVPSLRPATLFVYVSNLGCGPLTWNVRDVVPGTELDCPWVSESPDSGTVPPANSQPGFEGLAVSIARLPGRTYETDLRFTSNDPVRPLVVV